MMMRRRLIAFLCELLIPGTNAAQVQKSRIKAMRY